MHDRTHRGNGGGILGRRGIRSRWLIDGQEALKRNRQQTAEDNHKRHVGNICPFLRKKDLHQQEDTHESQEEKKPWMKLRELRKRKTKEGE